MDTIPTESMSSPTVSNEEPFETEPTTEKDGKSIDGKSSESESSSDSGSSTASTPASPESTPQGQELILDVECGLNKGVLYLNRLSTGSKGACVLFDNAWLTPNEFQYVSGRETAKDWKRSIKHYGKSLKLLIAKGFMTTEPAFCKCEGCVAPDDKSEKGEVELAPKSNQENVPPEDAAQENPAQPEATLSTKDKQRPEVSDGHVTLSTGCDSKASAEITGRAVLQTLGDEAGDTTPEAAKKKAKKRKSQSKNAERPKKPRKASTDSESIPGGEQSTEALTKNNGQIDQSRMPTPGAKSLNGQETTQFEGRLSLVTGVAPEGTRVIAGCGQDSERNCDVYSAHTAANPEVSRVNVALEGEADRKSFNTDIQSTTAGGIVARDESDRDTINGRDYKSTQMDVVVDKASTANITLLDSQQDRPGKHGMDAEKPDEASLAKTHVISQPEVERVTSQKGDGSADVPLEAIPISLIDRASATPEGDHTVERSSAPASPCADTEKLVVHARGNHVEDFVSEGVLPLSPRKEARLTNIIAELKSYKKQLIQRIEEQHVNGDEGLKDTVEEVKVMENEIKLMESNVAAKLAPDTKKEEKASSSTSDPGCRSLYQILSTGNVSESSFKPLSASNNNNYTNGNYNTSKTASIPSGKKDPDTQPVRSSFSHKEQRTEVKKPKPKQMSPPRDTKRDSTPVKSSSDKKSSPRIPPVMTTLPGTGVSPIAPIPTSMYLAPPLFPYPYGIPPGYLYPGSIYTGFPFPDPTAIYKSLAASNALPTTLADYPIPGFSPYKSPVASNGYPSPSNSAKKEPRSSSKSSKKGSSPLPVTPITPVIPSATYPPMYPHFMLPEMAYMSPSTNGHVGRSSSSSKSATATTTSTSSNSKSKSSSRERPSAESSDVLDLSVKKRPSPSIDLNNLSGKRPCFEPPSFHHRNGLVLDLSKGSAR